MQIYLPSMDNSLQNACKSFSYFGEKLHPHNYNFCDSVCLRPSPAMQGKLNGVTQESDWLCRGAWVLCKCSPPSHCIDVS